jgi:hypothetical protein
VDRASSGACSVIAGSACSRARAGQRWLAIFGVAINAVSAGCVSVEYPQAYPLWNILIVTLNFVVLYALTARWRDSREPWGTPRPDRMQEPPAEGGFRAGRLTVGASSPRHVDSHLEVRSHVARRGTRLPAPLGRRRTAANHAANLLGFDAELAATARFIRYRDRRRIDRDKSRDGYEARVSPESRLDAS